MSSATDDDVHTLAQRLADDLRKDGLKAEVIAATRVRVSLPGAHQRLTETVRCMVDRQERLWWWWSWGDPICAADRTAEAVKLIRHVVTPPMTGSE